MSDQSHNPAQVVPASQPDDLPAPLTHAAVVDAHGFDPDEFEWRPVARRPRADGWKPEVQRAFIDALADSGIVETAAREVDMSVASCYRLRRAPGGESFARAWDAALAHASQRLVDVAFERAIEGFEQPVFDRDGCRIGARRQYSDRLLMFLLRAYRPDRFRHAAAPDQGDHGDPREAAPIAAPALDTASAALMPVVPPDPHLLMTAEKLDYAIAAQRGIAEVHELYPIDEREPYAIRPSEPDHDGPHARRMERHARKDRAEVRRNALR